MEPPKAQSIGVGRKGFSSKHIRGMIYIFTGIVIFLFATGAIIWVLIQLGIIHSDWVNKLPGIFAGLGAGVTVLGAFLGAVQSFLSSLPDDPPSTSEPDTSAPPTRHNKSLLDSVRSLVEKSREAEKDLETEDESDESNQRQLFTALDVGTSYAKAMIVEVHGDEFEVLGVGRHPQSYSHMSDGIVTDIPSVIENCNQALLKAEKAAGGIIAPPAIIGIAGELVKGSSTRVSRQRPNPNKPITAEELDSLITAAQQRLLKDARERIAAETGYMNIEVRLTNASVIAVRIDGPLVTNPVGFCGRHFALTLFSSFAPLMQLRALEAVAQGLDLTPLAIVAEPYALARSLTTNASEDSGAIFIDIGGGTTDIALVRQGGIEETRMFALGGRAFTRRIATGKGISIKDAERLKIIYSNGEIKGNARDEIHAILAPECQTWLDSVELLIDELAKGELLPPAIYLVGGGAALPDLHEKLERFPWTERLPFAREPIIRIMLPEMVPNVQDPRGLLINAQDITPMALAYQAVEIQNENDILERALDRVINNMHI